MAKRPSVKEILEAARKAGPAQPASEQASEAAEAAEPESSAVEEAPKAKAAPAAPPRAAAAPAANVPTPSALGRPLTLKEKLAAARAGAGAAPAPAAAVPSAAPPAAEEIAEAAEEVEPAAAEAPKTVPAPPSPTGRPLTLAEKLAAARGGGGGAAPAKPAAAKPAAGAKPAAKPAAAAKAAPAAKVTRALPPLAEMSDPKDLAEALRQTGAQKEAAVKAATAKAAPAAAAKGGHKESKPQSVLPRPKRREIDAATATALAERRGFLIGSFFVSWIVLGWASFTAAMSAMTLMTVRFMFPNVLAEPSTIKVGSPSNYEPEAVDERFKAEWKFWIVRSTRYEGNDIIYALSSTCTHLGCPPNWLAGEQKFKCPCHGSGFYISGINFEGPAPRPLERFKISLGDDGQLIVDTSVKFQQEMGQWSDPDSFIVA